MGSTIPVNKHDVGFAVDALLRSAPTMSGRDLIEVLVNHPRPEVLAEFTQRIEARRAGKAKEVAGPKHRSADEFNNP